MPPSNAGPSIGYTVTVNDLASKRIDAIAGSMTKLNAPTQKAGKSLAELSLQRADKVVSGMRDLTRASQDAFRATSQLVSPLAMITSAATVAGLARITSDWAKLGTELGNSAKRAGIGVDQLSALQGAARLAGSSTGALNSGLTSLNDNLTLAASGRSIEAVQAFNYLHINLRNADGSLKDVNKALPEVADALAKVKNPTIQAQLATMLFGGAAEDLLPLLRRGAAGIAELSEKSKKAGIINQAGAEAADLLRQKQENLTQSVEGLGYSIAEKLAPVVGPMLDDLATWTQKNKDVIAEDVADWVKKAVPEIEKFAGQANSVAQALGGWKTVIEGIIAINVAGWAAGTIAKFIPILRILALIPGSGVSSAMVAGLVGGAVAGGMNLPTLDDQGNRTGNFGGKQGEDAEQAEKYWQMFRNMPWGDDKGLLGRFMAPLRPNSYNPAFHHDKASDLPGMAGAAPSSGGGIMHWLGEHLNPFGSAHAAERPMVPRSPQLGSITGSPASLTVPGSSIPAGPVISGDGALPSPSGRLPRGVRNNNPGNLRSWAGAGQSDGYAVFRNAQEGLTAMRQNLEAYYSKHGIDTLRGIIMRWAPPSDGNNTEAYIANVAKWAGMANPDQHLNMNDPALKAAMMRAMIHVEQGYNAYSDKMINQAAGVPGGAPTASVPSPAMPGGPPAALPAGPAAAVPSGPPARIPDGGWERSAGNMTVNGQANVRLSLAGFPPGTKAAATTEGDLFSHTGPVRIESGMVGTGSTA